MTDSNPIRKQRVQFAFSVVNGRPRYHRHWVAVCPKCRIVIDTGVLGVLG